MSFFNFRILVLGADIDYILSYISKAFGGKGEEKEAYFSWYKEFKVLDHVCDLQIDVICRLSPELDAIIPLTDGIIYILDPTIPKQRELIEMVVPDIFAIKRDIPTIILFSFLVKKAKVNEQELLQKAWVDFPFSEVFINIAPKEFYQLLICLCKAMVNAEKSKEHAIEKIKTIMKKESVNEIAIERKYLPEMFSVNLLELYHLDDGLPTIKESVIEYLKNRGITSKYYGNVIKFFEEN